MLVDKDESKIPDLSGHLDKDIYNNNIGKVDFNLEGNNCFITLLFYLNLFRSLIILKVLNSMKKEIMWCQTS